MLNRCVIGLAAALICIFATTAEAQLGNCDSAVQREKRMITFNAESRVDTDTTVAIHKPCSIETITITKCAIIGVLDKKAQHYCFPSDRPAYFEYTNVIEYWESPNASKSAPAQ